MVVEATRTVEDRLKQRVHELATEVNKAYASLGRLQHYVLVAERVGTTSAADMRRFYNAMVLPEQRLRPEDCPLPDEPAL